jgi:hypothetical protein
MQQPLLTAKKPWRLRGILDREIPGRTLDTVFQKPDGCGHSFVHVDCTLVFKGVALGIPF